MVFLGIPIARVADALRRWWPHLLLVAASGGIGSAWTYYHVQPTTASPTADLKAAGKAYPRALAVHYAEAWRKGADRLEAGESVPKALAVVAESWTGGRTTLFDKVLAPAFVAVVPEGRPDEEVSSEQKARLAALWRSFAAGLSAAK